PAPSRRDVGSRGRAEAELPRPQQCTACSRPGARSTPTEPGLADRLRFGRRAGVQPVVVAVAVAVVGIVSAGVVPNVVVDLDGATGARGGARFSAYCAPSKGFHSGSTRGVTKSFGGVEPI